MSLWIVEYDNSDDSFSEWWTVTDGHREFRCYSEDDAKWLLNVLLAIKEPA